MCFLFTEIIFFLKLLTRDEMVLISCDNIVQSIHLTEITKIFFYHLYSIMFVANYENIKGHVLSDVTHLIIIVPPILAFSSFRGQ